MMASKNLKAIVVRGHSIKPQVADQAALSALHKAGPGMSATNADVDGLGKLGTPGVVMFQNMLGTLPDRVIIMKDNSSRLNQSVARRWQKPS